MRLTLALTWSCLLAACGGPGNDGPGGDPGARPDGGSAADASPEQASCTGPATCAAWNVRSACEAGVRIEQTCAVGCFQGECSSTQCADECAPGDTGAGTCALYELASGQFVSASPAGSMHDRARDYDHYLPSNLAEGGVAEPRYTDETYTRVEDWGGLADSALWTGTALATAGWHAMATGSAQSQGRIEQHVETLHRFFNVSGVPGYLARWVAPADAYAQMFQCDARVHHCDESYDGQSYDWTGGTSRDQYTGVILGYYAGYEASADPEVRATIRADVVELALELMKERQEVPARIEVGSFKLNTTLDITNSIVIESEFENGRVFIKLDTSAGDGGDLHGVREFMPDLGEALRQVPGLGWLPDIPRPGSAIMIGAIFALARHVAAEDPALSDELEQISEYYDVHFNEWYDVGRGWDYSGTCGSGYYGIHITYISAYVWAMLETDPMRKSKVRDGLLAQRGWPIVENHKNPYFAYLWAGTQTAPDQAAVAAASDQLSRFSPGPRVFVGTDVVDQYPHDDSCQTNGRPEADKSTAVDVGDRVLEGFLWQRSPWGLYADGDRRVVFPGVNYLAAYWAGRAHALISDDRPGTCARWQ